MQLCNVMTITIGADPRKLCLGLCETHLPTYDLDTNNDWPLNPFCTLVWYYYRVIVANFITLGPIPTAKYLTNNYCYNLKQTSSWFKIG